MILPGAPDAPLHLPREVVLASAGTGKTYTLSSRMIGLLALGAPPETLLATTFTRKAAGEILNRVLSRLAEAVLDPERARELANSALLGGTPATASMSPQAAFSGLLLALTRDLHRVSVGTLDSFFVGVARCFPGELGMPPAWTISDAPTVLRLEAEALQEVLSRAGPREMVELVRMTMRGERVRGVQGRLLRQLTEIRDLLYQRGVEDPGGVWMPPGHPRSRTGEGDAPVWEEVLPLLESAPLPFTSRGEPDRRFQDAVDAALASLRREDWAAFCGKALVRNVLEGTPTYYRASIPAGLVTAIQRALAGVRGALIGTLKRQAQALRTLALAYDGVLSELQRKEGVYGFRDITFLLGGLNARVTMPDLWYRLDLRAGHLLLDEFQDTSKAQWRALEPLAEELLAGHAEERSGIVVADPKQSIYGWRGAEPDLVRRVARRFGLDALTLDLSYRSAGPVLDLVNQVFRDLPENPVWGSAPDLVSGVRRWWEAFPIHRPALDHQGFVLMEAGPGKGAGGSGGEPDFLAWSAERISVLHKDRPGASIGVLVRRNATASRVIALLRSLGVEASEEGSAALADFPAVSAFLALFRMADHPGDTVARYHVSQSPLGPLVGLETHGDARAARKVAWELRRELMVGGYGSTLLGLVRDLTGSGALGVGDLPRVLQLVELGHRWDERPALRPQDFVRFVETATLEAPTSSRVRVMTVHRAKGLEFDAVVLPELDQRLVSGAGLYQSVLPLRDPDSGSVRRIFPRLAKELLPLFPEMEEAARQDQERELLDALGVLYVALTRARSALYLFTAADPPGGSSKIPFSFAGLLRGALGWGDKETTAGSILYRDGVEDWSPTSPAPGRDAEETGKTEGDPPLPIRLSLGGRRVRLLPHRSPTGLEGRAEVRLHEVLSLAPSRDRSRQVGTVVHAWMEGVGWLEDWAPDWEVLRTMAQERAPDLTAEEVEKLRRDLTAWLAAPAVRAALSREAYPGPGTAEVRTELPFAVRLQDVLYEGRMDRVVTLREGNRVTSAEVLDFKTDAPSSAHGPALEEPVEAYRGQMGIYREALGQLYRLPPSRTRASLVLLRSGRILPLRNPPP